MLASAMIPPLKAVSERLRFSGPIELRTNTGKRLRGIAQDISAGGIGVILYADLEVGESVVIHFPHPTHGASQVVRHSACVRRRFANRYGFEFTDYPSAAGQA